ncbi:hypothetical protein C8Q74DRAFT_4461 [Fomes fomentarius]|nr:hypothetical protein C8Q74DRAFT_4461 [Fomes fomentarius]
MDLFAGNACFSPQVPPSVQRQWVAHGGDVARLEPDSTDAIYVFCDGHGDPWFYRFYQRSMAIFHWSWIPAVIQVGFRLPISPYIIEEPSEDDVHSIDPRIEEGSNPGSSNSRNDAYGSDADCLRNRVIELDLRAIDNARRVTKSHTRLFSVQPLDLEDATLVWDREASGSEGLDTSQDLSSLSGFSGTPVISVSDALKALREVSTEGAVQFLPGTSHGDRTFSCCFVREVGKERRSCERR